jgi:hypothetical protein
MLTNNSPRRSSLLAKRGDVTPFDRVMAPGMQKRQDEQSFMNRVVRPLAQRLTDPSSALMKNVNFDDIRFRLLRAGFPYGLRAQDFMLIKLLGTAGGVFLFTVVLVPLANMLWGIGYSPLVMLWGALLGAFYGFKLPDFWLSMTIKRRQNAIQFFMPT